MTKHVFERYSYSDTLFYCGELTRETEKTLFVKVTDGYSGRFSERRILKKENVVEVIECIDPDAVVAAFGTTFRGHAQDIADLQKRYQEGIMHRREASMTAAKAEAERQMKEAE